MDKVMAGHSYSLWHLFKDDQRRILDQIMTTALEEVERSFRSAYDRSLPLMKVSEEMRLRLPNALSATVGFIINTDLRHALEQTVPDVDRLKRLVEEAKRWDIDIDTTTLGFVGSGRCNELMEAFQERPGDIDLLESLEGVLSSMQRLDVTLDVWPVQNIYFRMTHALHAEYRDKAESGSEVAKRWIAAFEQLGEYLQVRTT